MFGNLRTYFQESWAELRKVSWPDRQTVVNLTLIVIGVSIAVGAYIAILDQVDALRPVAGVQVSDETRTQTELAEPMDDDPREAWPGRGS